jgi:hypothetical protein
MGCLNRRSRERYDNPEQLPTRTPQGQADYAVCQYSNDIANRFSHMLKAALPRVQMS